VSSLRGGRGLALLEDERSRLGRFVGSIPESKPYEAAGLSDSSKPMWDASGAVDPRPTTCDTRLCR
jgi:hypothetical protein